MGGVISEAVLFLVNALFVLATYVFLIRFLFEWSGVDFYNPLSQALYKLTAPVLSPFQKFLPAWRELNLACLLLLLVIVFLRVWLAGLLAGFSPRFGGVLILAVGDLVGSVIQVYTFAVLAIVILSWVSPYQYNPFVSALYKLTDPLMRRARRWIPPIGVIDISPLVVLLALQFFNLLVSKLLIRIGQGMI